MSFGTQSWGLGSWGGSSFIVTNHNPIDGSIGNSRTPTISFILSSETDSVTLPSINLSTNSTPLITNGLFTSNATGTIDSTDPLNVIVTATTTFSFDVNQDVLVEISALNAANQSLFSGMFWTFYVGATIRTFATYVIRGFERIFRLA